jgi:DNA segregation ATPase FtsK/SpoIIIE-like protein
MTPVGVGPAGDVWRPLNKILHALIVGRTGSGKSMWVHAALAGLLTGATAQQLQVYLIDPKRSEFKIWKDAPQVVRYEKNLGQATEIVQALARELDRRGDLMEAAPGVCRDLEDYNKKQQPPLPYVLCVVDECLDLVGDAAPDGRAFDAALDRLAQRGRSCGIFLWLATTHATALAGLPRKTVANIESRFCFRVVDEAAARAAQCPGAEGLPSDTPGRMLARLERREVLQGFYVGNEELEQIADSVKQVDKERVNEERIDRGAARLVQYAEEQLDGEFVVNKLAARFGKEGWTNHKVRKLAEEWERREWLLPAAGVTSGRLVTVRLAEMAACALGEADAHGDAQGAHTDAYAELFNPGAARVCD